MASGPGGFQVGRVSVQVVPDTSDFKKQLLGDLRRIEKELRIEIPVDVDMKAAVAQLKVLDQQIKDIDKDINIDVDTKGVNAQLSRVASQANSAGEGFSSMSRAALIGYGILVLLAPAISLVATLIAGLPSLLLAGGAAFAAIGLGMDGFKKAASAFTPTVDRLKASLSANFENTLTPVFQNLNKLAPILDVGLNKVADGIGSIITKVADFVTSSKGMVEIQQILNGTAVFFEKLAPAIAAGTDAFLSLGAAGAQQLNILADVLGKFSTGFNTAVQNLIGSGAFATAITGIAKVLDSVLTLFNRLFDAGVRAMGQLGGPIATLINGLGDAVIALMPALTDLSALVFNVVGEALSALAPIIKELTPAFHKLAEIVGTLLSAAIKVLQPVLEAVAKILGTVLLNALKALEPILPPIIKFFTALSDSLSKNLMKAFEALNPLIEKLVGFIQDFLVALEPLLPAIMDLIDTALTGLVDILTALAPHIIDIAEKALPPFIKAIVDVTPSVIDILKAFSDLIPVLVDFAKTLIDVVGPIVTDLVKMISDAWPIISDLFKNGFEVIVDLVKLGTAILKGDWSGALEALKNLARDAWEALVAAFKLGVQAVVNFFVDLPIKILAALVNLPTQLFGSGKNAIGQFIAGLASGEGEAVLKTSNIAGRVRGMFPNSPAKEGPFSGRGYTTFSGQALMEDWAKGMEAGTPAVLKAVDNVMSATQASMDFQGAISSDGFGSMGDRVSEALSGWAVQIDGNGLASLVNKANQQKERRG
jgi:phage-related protein